MVFRSSLRYTASNTISYMGSSVRNESSYAILEAFKLWERNNSQGAGALAPATFNVLI